MWGGCGCWESGSERELSLLLDTSLELSKDRFSGKIEDSGIENGTILKNLDDLHLVEERIDLELIEEGGLSGSNLLVLEHNLLGGNDINLSLNNLGLDLEGLEHGGLLWVKTGGTGWDDDISWGNHTWSSWGWSHLVVKDFLDLTKISVREDKVDVTLEHVHDLLNVWVEFPGLVSNLVVIISWLWLSGGISETSLHESVLTHDHNGINSSELLSKEADLLRGNVIGVNEKAVLVLGDEILESKPVCLLLDSSL